MKRTTFSFAAVLGLVALSALSNTALAGKGFSFGGGGGGGGGGNRMSMRSSLNGNSGGNSGGMTLNRNMNSIRPLNNSGNSGGLSSIKSQQFKPQQFRPQIQPQIKSGNLGGLNGITRQGSSGGINVQRIGSNPIVNQNGVSKNIINKNVINNNVQQRLGDVQSRIDLKKVGSNSPLVEQIQGHLGGKRDLPKSIAGSIGVQKVLSHNDHGHDNKHCGSLVKWCDPFHHNHCYKPCFKVCKPVCYHETVYVYSQPIVVEVPVPVEVPVAEERLMQVPVGATLTLQADGMGEAQGQVVLQMEKVAMASLIREWTPAGVTATLPPMELAAPVIAEILILNADGSLANGMKVELIPAPLAAAAPVGADAPLGAVGPDASSLDAAGFDAASQAAAALTGIER